MKKKLVRDLIPDIMREKGVEPKMHIADEKEYQEALFEKLAEETEEFKENPCVEEAGDIQEVVDALFALYGLSYTEVEAVQKQKREKRGGFEKRIILRDWD